MVREDEKQGEKQLLAGAKLISSWKMGFPFRDAVLDVVVLKQDEDRVVKSIECNPFGAWCSSGPSLFSWLKHDLCGWGSGEEIILLPRFEFRPYWQIQKDRALREGYVEEASRLAPHAVTWIETQSVGVRARSGICERCLYDLSVTKTPKCQTEENGIDGRRNECCKHLAQRT